MRRHDDDGGSDDGHGCVEIGSQLCVVNDKIGNWEGEPLPRRPSVFLYHYRLCKLMLTFSFFFISGA